MNTLKTCATCRWYEVCDDGTGACTNEASQNWEEYMLPEDTCEAWEGKDG